MDGNNHQLPPEARHEHADINIWAIGRFGIALALLCIVAVGLLAGLFRYFEARVGGPVPSTRVNLDATKKPPAPYLQDAPITDLKAMRAAEEQILNGYGWIDQANGVVRVPIAQAIEMLAARGLPARQAMPAPSNVTVPTESGMGPKMQRPGGPLNQASGIGGQGSGMTGSSGQGN
jgi:hypothetical protein